MVNVERIGGPTNIDTGLGHDTVRVGDKTGDKGQITGSLDSLGNAGSKLNDAAGNPYIQSRLTISGGDGINDLIKVYDSADSRNENGTLRNSEIVGFGMTFGIGYQGFETLKLWLGNGDNGLFIDSTHLGVTFIDTGDEIPQPNVN